MSQRDRQGWWCDFDTLAGTSDEWVTGYVGAVLAGESEPRAREAARDAWRLLRRRRPWARGWGYNLRVPVDADSTIWALCLANGLDDLQGRPARRGLARLDRHVLASGAVATYRSPGPIRWFTRLGRSVSFDGWCGGHVCVTAAAGTIPVSRHDRVISFLRSAQSANGNWPAYWWRNDEYSTMLAAEALAQTGDQSDLDRVRRAAVAMHERIDVLGAVTPAAGHPGSPFATACAAQVVALGGNAAMLDRVHAAAGWLVAVQDSEGAWRSSAALRIPPPSVRDPDTYEGWVPGKGGGSLVLDQNRFYTTSTVLRALRFIASRLESSDDTVAADRSQQAVRRDEVSP